MRTWLAEIVSRFCPYCRAERRYRMELNDWIWDDRPGSEPPHFDFTDRPFGAPPDIEPIEQR